MNWRLARRASRLGWPVCEQLASPLAQLLLTPVLLHRLGAIEFGLWILALTPLVAASTLSLGRSSSLMAVVPRFHAERQDAAIRQMVWRVLGLIAMASVVVGLLMILCRQWLAEMLPSSLQQPLFYMTMAMLLVTATELDNTISGSLKGLGNFRAVALVELVSRAIQIVATVLVINSSSTAGTALSIGVAVSLLKFFVKGHLLHIQLSPLPGVAEIDHDSSAAHLRSTGFWMWVQVMCGLVFYSFDRWAVNYFFGAAALGSYAICSQLAQLSHALSAAASQPLIPWAATRAASRPTVEGAESVRRITLLASLGAAVLPALVTVFAGPLLAFWISAKFAASHRVMASELGLVFLVLAVNVPSFNLLIGWGQTRFASMLTLVAATFFVVTCLAIRPEAVSTIIFLKMGYAVVGLAAVVKLLAFLRGTGRKPPAMQTAPPT